MNLDPIWVFEGVIGIVLFLIILRVEQGHFRRKTKTWRTKAK